VSEQKIGGRTRAEWASGLARLGGYERGHKAIRWEEIDGLLSAAFTEGRGESEKLRFAREAVRTLAKQLERRSQGRDAETQGLLAQVGRMREALEKIVRYPYGNLEELRDIARAALASKGAGQPKRSEHADWCNLDRPHDGRCLRWDANRGSYFAGPAEPTPAQPRQGVWCAMSVGCIPDRPCTRPLNHEGEHSWSPEPAQPMAAQPMADRCGALLEPDAEDLACTEPTGHRGTHIHRCKDGCEPCHVVLVPAAHPPAKAPEPQHDCGLTGRNLSDPPCPACHKDCKGCGACAAVSR
jgi:hypothetical protein